MEKLEQLLKNNFFTAIDKHDFKKVKGYVKKARKINKKKELINGEMNGIKPIHRAVYAYNFKALRFLLHNGADINAISNMCFSPFAYVTTMNNETEETAYTNNEIKKIAHDHCSSTSPQEMQGFTALHLALFYCRLDIVRILVRNKNIDINIKNMNNETAFDVIGGYYNFSHGSYTIEEVLSITANNVTEDDCKAKLTSMKASIKVGLGANSVTDSVSSAVKPSSFINSMFNWVGASTIAALGHSTPSLPPAQQPGTYPAGSSISSSQVDVNGTALLADIMVRKFTGERYLKPLDDSLLTLEEIKERKLNAIERDLNMAMSKFDQFPESSLNNVTISKIIDHQKFF